MNKLLVLMSLLVVGMFLAGCVQTEEGSEDSALAGQAITSLKPISCKDTDAQDPFTFGKVTYLYKKGSDPKVITATLSDKCSADGKSVQEQFCGPGGGKMPASKYIVCRFGCKNGACAKAAPVIACDSAKIQLKKTEKLGTVKPTLTNADLPNLLGPAELTLKTGEKFGYTQELDFSASQAYIDLLWNDDDVQDNFLYFQNGKLIYTYKLKFNTPLNLKVTLSSGEQGTMGYYVMNDIVNSKIKFMGKEYIVDKAYKPAGTNAIKFVLIEGTSTLILRDGYKGAGTGSSWEVFINNEEIDGAKVDLIWTESADSISLSEIKVNVTAEDDLYVNKGAYLSKILSDNGDEPQALFTNNWDIKLADYDASAGIGTVEIGNCNIPKIDAPAIFCTGVSNTVAQCNEAGSVYAKGNNPGITPSILGGSNYYAKDELPKILAFSCLADYQYHQYLYNEKNTLNGNVFNFYKNESFLRYKIEFTSPAESAYTDDQGYLNPAGKNLGSFLNKKMVILGKEYNVTEARSLNDHTTVKLVLKAVKSPEHEYTFIDDNLPDGKSTYQLQKNGGTINGAQVVIEGVSNSEVTKIYAIQIYMSAGQDYQLNPGQKLSEVISAAGDDPNVLATSSWDVKFDSYDAATGKATTIVGSIC